MTNTARVKAAEILARQHATLDRIAERARITEADWPAQTSPSAAIARAARDQSTWGAGIRAGAEAYRAALDGTPGYTVPEQSRRLHDINPDATQTSRKQDAA